jgi:hypothetical protein
MTSDLPGDMPSTIIAPDLSLSTVDTEIEIERSLPWTPARISRPIGLVSPGATTIASGQSAVLSHGNRAPLFPGRPHNPSPPSLPGSSIGGGDTFTPRLQPRRQDDQLYESFLPEFSEGDGIVQVGLGVCVDEFGTFLSENEPHEVAKDLDSDSNSGSGGSPQISLQDALALPIPLLVTPRASEIELGAVRGPGTPTPYRPPARLLRWRCNSSPGTVGQDAAAVDDTFYGRERELPDLSWHGLDADPFRCSPAPSVPTEVRDAGGADGGDDGGERYEAVASSRRMDTTFRWSIASAEVGPPHAPGHEHEGTHAHMMSLAALSALTRRIREQGRALLRKSRSNVLFSRTRLPDQSPLDQPPLPSPPPPPLGNIATALEGVGLGSVRRIGLGIGYSVPSPGSTAMLAQQTRGTCAPAYPVDDREGVFPAGCYAGLGGGRRGKKSAATVGQPQLPTGQQRDNLKAVGAATSADDRLACEPASAAARCDSGGVLILGNPGFGGAVAPATTANTR